MTVVSLGCSVDIHRQEALHPRHDEGPGPGPIFRANGGTRTPGRSTERCKRRSLELRAALGSKLWSLTRTVFMAGAAQLPKAVSKRVTNGDHQYFLGTPFADILNTFEH